MEIYRHFLGFDQPALAAASRFLVDLAGNATPVDLGHVVVVVPTGRAVRHLRAHLLRLAKSAGLGIIPPRIVTVSHLPELLYEPKRPFASSWVQHLAWTTALMRSDLDVRRRIAPALSELEVDTGDPEAAAGIDEGWLDVGRMLWRQYRELTAEALSFADVAERGSSLEGFFEASRWQALATVQNEYLRALDREGIWDKQTARLVAVRNQECHFAGQLILLGTVDLNRTMRQMIDQVSDRVTALVHAPEAWADRFDGHGCVDPAAWESVAIDMRDDRWRVAYGPQEQGQLISDILYDFDGEYSINDVTIGCADHTLVPFVQRSLSQRNVSTRWSGGTPLERTGPVRLLESLADLLDGMRFSRFSAWIRHPDVARWLATKKVYPLARIDRYYNEFLPATWTEPLRGDREVWRTAHLAIEHTKTLLAALREPRLPLTAWIPRIRKVIESVYAAQSVDLEEPTARTKHDACRAIDEALAGIAVLPSAFSMNVTATQAFRLIVSAITGERSAPAVSPEEIELLGWLDLPLDEAPALIVTGFNEKIVPQSVTSDLFLPDRLREHLEVNDNRRRYARDAYALSALLASKRSLHIITCQNDIHGEPLLPSRLLFCCDNETRASRWLRFSQAFSNLTQDLSPATDDEQRRNSLYNTPMPDDRVELPTALSVTAFKSYLQCPYHFYLQRVLRLDFQDDEARELPGNRFGTLIHTALERFGRSSARSLLESNDIYEAVSQELRKCAVEVCGESPLAAVRVQIEQALIRLKAFARVQAQLRKHGWEIAYVESDERTKVEWLVDDEPFVIYGMVDRIDVHAETGQVRVIDYKTGDFGVKLDTMWDAAKGWTDLQLPLYRHLAEALGFSGPHEAAYFVLPRRHEETTLLMVEWSDEQLRQADEQARDVIRRIRAREFWPPAEEAPPFSEPWRDIVAI